MKQILITLFLLTPIWVFSQDYFLEFDRYNSETNFDWRGLESADQYEVKIMFIEYVEKNNLLISERQRLEKMSLELRFSIKAVDINNDSQADIIYQGPHSGEGSIIHIFINDKSSFKNIFSSRQGITKVIWEGELIDKLLIRDWGCCADPNLVNSVYQVSYLNNIPHFELIWQSIELKDFLTKPKRYFEEPKRFEVINEIYKLRSNPFIDDTSEYHFLEIKGNSIGVLKKGFKGTAFASMEDNTGRTWWYVLIDKEYELEEAYINYPYYEFKPHLVGWISNRYVKELYQEK